MIHTSRYGLVAVLLVLFILSGAAPFQLALSASIDSAQLYSEIGSTFTRVRAIEGEGGNVSVVVGQLNEALGLVAAGEANETGAPDQAQTLYQQADAIIRSVNQELPGVESRGKASAQSEVFWLASTLAVLTAIGIGIFFFGGRIFWSLWVRSHRGWTVKKP